MIPPHPRPRTCKRRPVGVAGVICAILGVGLALGPLGCQVGRRVIDMPKKAASAVVPGPKAAEPNAETLQLEVERFADQYAAGTATALDDYAAGVGTPEARRQALLWKVSIGSAVVSVASGPNPRANLFDLLAIATITRTALEHVWTQTTIGGAFEPWLRTSQRLETTAWGLAAHVFTAEQQAEAREAIQKWWDANPSGRAGFFARPSEITSFIRRDHEPTARSDSIFGLVGLDPTAGLDPAVREITRSRLFAERSMFVAQRMPFIVRWQAELLSQQVLGQDAVTNALASADRLSRAAEKASQTVEQLPDRLSAEREAILGALEVQEGRLRELAAEIGRTLDAGGQMSASLNTTLGTFDALMKRFGMGEAGASSPPAADRPPFNILDYARTAEQIAAMARQLDELIRNTGGTLDSPALDRRLAELGALSARASADAKSILNHAFLLGAGLILLAFTCAVAYRRWTARARPLPPARPPQG